MKNGWRIRRKQAGSEVEETRQMQRKQAKQKKMTERATQSGGEGNRSECANGMKGGAKREAGRTVEEPYLVYRL